MTENSRNLAIVFADVAGSTGLYESHGDVRALAAIGGCIDLMQAVTSEFGGRVIKTIGDELMAVFDTAEDAFCAACEIQWRGLDLPPCGTDKITVRIGFHFGQALEQAGDVFGDSVNIAARLAALAKAGQILTSGRTFEVINPTYKTHMRKLKNLTLRGMSNDETVYEGLWEDEEDITSLLSGVMAQPCTSAQGKFRYGGVDIDFGPYSRQVTFGRDSSNTVAVSSRKASRTHARIERRRDKLFLIDQSANGTFVRDDRGRETVLHLEEMVLHGRGLVSFGEPVAAGSKWLEYSVDDHAVSEEQPQRTGTAAG